MSGVKDVAVIGAGPAGLHAAYRLAASGLDVALVEAQPQVGDGAICSGVIGEEAFARFSLPPDAVVSHIRRIQAISPAGRVLDHHNGDVLARVVNKAEFNRALAARTLRAGAEIRLNQRVESLEQEKHHVTLHLRETDGCGSLLHARVAVIATGVNCSLSRLLGLARPKQMLRAIQADIASPAGGPSSPTKVYVGRSVAPGAFAWEIPLDSGTVRAGLMTTYHPKPYFQTFLRRIAPTTEGSVAGMNQKGIAQAPSGRCTTDRVLLIGEAAGHVKTSTGGGIYYGLVSAELAAEVILRAFRKGDLSWRVLSEFERYWRTAFGNELLVAYFARGLASRFPDSFIEDLFDFAISSNILVRLDGNLKFDWHRKALLTALRSLVTLPGGGRGRGFGH